MCKENFCASTQRILICSVTLRMCVCCIMHIWIIFNVTLTDVRFPLSSFSLPLWCLLHAFCSCFGWLCARCGYDIVQGVKEIAALACRISQRERKVTRNSANAFKAHASIISRAKKEYRNGSISILLKEYFLQTKRIEIIRMWQTYMNEFTNACVK